MSQLLQNRIIKSSVFSIYILDDYSGHINFGGWEKEGIDPNETAGLTMLHTVSKSDWKIPIGEVILDQKYIMFDVFKTKTAIFDPGYGFLYLPL